MGEKKDNGEGDYRNTILYRNTQAVMDTLDARQELLDALQVENQRFRSELTQFQQEHAQTRHMVDTMWVKWMGHGSTE
jgi:hypothetical protein